MGRMQRIFSSICERYDTNIKGLGLNISLNDEYETILKHLHTGVNCDYVASRGEYLCSRIMAAYLGYDFVDATEMIAFNSDGTLDAEKINNCTGEILKNHHHAVVPGFYGVKENQEIVTFSRGGSDITGALIAKGVDADIYENWTDMPGFLMAPPPLIPNAGKVDFMRYSELLQLSRLDFGKKYCHESPTIEESVLHEAIMEAVFKTALQNAENIFSVPNRQE